MKPIIDLSPSRSRAVAGGRRLLRRAVAFAAPLLAVAVAAMPARAAAVTTCEARSGSLRTTVVELYTSEGCNSCPPADRWLSSLKSSAAPPQPLLAIAFHVDYWDRLGWTDRFADPAHAERQRRVVASQGGRVVYTPQVIVDGTDWRGWPRLPKPSGAAPVSLQLARAGDTVTAQVDAAAGAAAPAGRIGGYWVLLEDGHHSDVRAGENAGIRLRHDHVVRAYQPVDSWPAGQSRRLSWQLPHLRDGGGDSIASARRVGFVVVDEGSGRPLQALALDC